MSKYESLDQVNTSRIELQGYLLQLNPSILPIFRKWEQRYYCLEGDKIYLYASKDVLEHLEFISLTEIEDIEKNPPTVQNEDALLITQKDKKSFIIKTKDPMDLPSLKRGIQSWSEYFVLKKIQSQELAQLDKSTNFGTNSQNKFEDFEDNYGREAMEVELDWILDVLTTQEKSMLNSLKKIDILKSDGFSLKQALELNQIPEKQNANKFLEEIKREFKLIESDIYNLLPKKIRKQQNVTVISEKEEISDLYEDLSSDDFRSLSFRKKMNTLKTVNESNERDIEDLRKKLFLSYLNNFYSSHPKKEFNLDEDTFF
eukprot:TRINITY_DN13014_c0_g1_i1.p1 TRINITY_DN13014_c0_g1~~TRINITY_DN13014_c0_g1_i1.p1  ORF type:complete len:315 (-),score=90.05 TRINITY_DN13014_c0_g1_i1:37-981(-)